MKFNHLFYDSHINFKSISKKKLVLSILLGLVSALIIYSFFYALRETTRMMSLGFDNRPNIISESNRNLYNLFFAAISLIFGNSIAINFLISWPQNIFSRRNIKRGRILNDQTFLGFNFIYWFTKIWILFTAFSVGFMDLPYLDYFLLPSILLIIVLYLESWKTLILVIRKHRWKIQIIHLVIFMLLTFILSRVDIVDYKAIDNSTLRSRPFIDVPSSSYQKDNYDKYYYEDLVFKMDFISDTEVGLFNVANEQIELYDVYSYIKDWNEQMSIQYYSRFSPKLRANKNIPIKYIKQVELELIDSNQWNIIYEISNDDELTSRFDNNQLRHRISPSLQEELIQIGSPPRVAGWDRYKERKFQDTLRLHISDRIELNKKEVPLNMLSRKLKNHINKSTLIEYIYADNVTYQDYINVLSAHKTAVWKLRATENYDVIDAQYYQNQFNRDEELNKERWRLREKYPIHITERFE